MRFTNKTEKEKKSSRTQQKKGHMKSEQGTYIYIMKHKDRYSKGDQQSQLVLQLLLTQNSDASGRLLVTAAISQIDTIATTFLNC